MLICLLLVCLPQRFLRAESFRKALVYQKRYLLLLIGGFKDCEDVTLAFISRLGIRHCLPQATCRHSTAMARFRAAGFAALGVARMRILSRKWSLGRSARSTGVTSSAQSPRPYAARLERLNEKLRSSLQSLA